uniref:APAF-1 helical domain-containing protein n=1 Tax=Anopheles atroparvus TaxID=41427 RepID=A0A182ILT6_ANOAO
MNDLNCLKTLRFELRDFDIYDVAQDLIDHRVFSSEEFVEIVSEQNESFRIDLLFIMLECKQHHDPQIVPRFMEAMRRYYDWIVEMWEKNRVKDSHETKRYNSFRNETSVPSHDSVSVYRKDLRWAIHKHLMSLRHGASEHRYLFIYGKIGTGKQTIVSQACEDFTIVRQMGYNIFYLDLADCNSDDAVLELLEKLSVQLGDSVRQDDRGMNCSYPSNMIDSWKRTFTKLFEKLYPDSLLVLAHVRHAKNVRDFDFKCKTVVITSDKDVTNVVNERERFQVDMPEGFTEAESLELFARALKKKNSMLPKEAADLCRACQGNPFLINQMAVRMSEECRNEVPIDWQQHIYSLQNFSIGKTEKIASTLGQFTAEEQQCFRDLVIFRDNVPLSPRVLEMYWEKNKETTECFLSKLERRGLLEKRLRKNKLYYMLQYICYNEIKRPSGADIVNLHRRLLKNYSIREKIAIRRELEEEYPDDDYFHLYIGYHIDAAGEHDLFQELYQDFGFLDQKLRFAGLANTVGDMRKYQDYIFPALEDRDSVVDTMIDFLMGAECLLSDDARLLQLALNFPGEIARMAELQVEKYKNRVWLRDVAHCLESSVVKLCHRPVKVRFHDSDHVFVFLANYDIQLWNLSVEYDVPPMTFKGCGGDQVVDMQRTSQFVLALSRRGAIKIWSTKNLPDRADYRMQSIISREAERTLSPTTGGFSCFCVLNQSNHTELIAMSEAGVLCIYKVYTSVFRANKMDNMFPTNIKNAYHLLPLEQEGRVGSAVRWFLFMAKENEVPVGIIFNMMSTSVQFKFEEPITLNVYQMPEGLVFVNDRQVRHRKITATGLDEPSIVYENKYCDNTCSVLTKDKLYIVLGTERGISIISIWEGIEIRRMNVSHSIVDLDVLPIEVNMPHMLLASISKDGENTMNLYNLSVTTGNQVVSSQYQLEGTTVFLASLDQEPVVLHTVDRRYTLQQTPLVDNDWGVSHDRMFKHEKIDAPVCCLIETPSAYYLGLENGKLLRLSEWRQGAEVKELADLQTEVNYLEYFRREVDDIVSEVLVVAGTDQCKLYVNEQEVEVEFAGTVRKCYLLYDRFLLLIGARCSVQIYDMDMRSMELVQNVMERSYGASVYHHLPRPALILCTTDGIVYYLGLHQATIESFNLTPFDLLLTVKPLQNRKTTEVICSCALSADGEFLAVGCYDGRIILHLMDLSRQLSVLESHQFPVEELYFSNWSEPGAPHILVSVGEQIVFWSVDYLYNNQPRKSFSSVRLSGRFTSRKFATATDASASPSEGRRSNGGNQSGLSTPIVGSPVQRSFMGEPFGFGESTYWNEKRGSTAKPHLLSCIKLSGRANRLIINREFSKFLTMDNEGYIHYLRLYRPSPNQLMLPSPPQATIGLRVANGSGHGNGASNGSYTYI